MRRRSIALPYSVVPRVALLVWCVLGAFALPALAATGVGGSMSGPLSLFVALSIIGLFSTGFFAGAETAFLSANLPRLQALADEGNRAARTAVAVCGPRERTQAAILLGTNIATVVAASSSLVLLTRTTEGLTPETRGALNTLIMTPLILLIGEIIPKSIGRAHPDFVLLRASRLLAMTDWLFRPVVHAVLGVSLLFMRLTGQKGEVHIVTREDLRLLAEMGEDEGVLELEHRRMIHGVLETYEQRVEQVMRPFTDIISLEEGANVTEFMAQVAECGYSRIPVYRERVDNIVGVVYVLDVIYAETPPETIDPVIRRDLQFVPETKRVATLLAELRFRHNPMAFVVDEYGGIIGLVTMEDLVEEIVGEIRDERDDEDDDYEVNELTRTIECDGKTEVDALNEELEKVDAEIPDGDYETIAGFVIQQLDRIPSVSDVAETDDVMVIVLAADERSVQRVRIIAKRTGERDRNGTNGK
ncbi:HlyC/CorC family transporter [Candidatus Poribacteria bacterium]|nr:HlyC/CorC family transporter [Candidatus Poribacteria bacterium]MBT5531873.1 HlyC/CorC family transporter [Candidatus Poribacteria bacterium]MBT5712207.1 HlyC/CorC family transporter [Candidatus Poribacteria bacterium]MBT7098271.1 HlyC/CorC family transporter [Candidatus Poribacteria bacterium]MBT7808612.1 HlyC/CorC family transporter [Candidatus Poribacteria bacterium]